MTVFGWWTVFLWVFLGLARGTDTLLAKALCAFMAVGTLAWGTGAL